MHFELEHYSTIAKVLILAVLFLAWSSNVPQDEAFGALEISDLPCPIFLRHGREKGVKGDEKDNGEEKEDE